MLLSSALYLVDARSDGAPLGACAQLEPMHPPNNQSMDTIPYGPNLSDFPNRTYVPERGYTSEYIVLCSQSCIYMIQNTCTTLQQ